MTKKNEFSKHRNQTETETTTETETETDGQQTNSKTGDSLSDKARKKKIKCNQQKVKQYKKNAKNKKKMLNKKPETKTIAARCKGGGCKVGRVEGEGDHSLQKVPASRCPMGGKTKSKRTAGKRRISKVGSRATT